MESKHGKYYVEYDGNLALLIEPVWNRNVYKASDDMLIAELLIEPVWNRNAHWVFGFRCDASAFNRTSMESKLMTWKIVNACLEDF